MRGAIPLLLQYASILTFYTLPDVKSLLDIPVEFLEEFTFVAFTRESFHSKKMNRFLYREMALGFIVV